MDKTSMYCRLSEVHGKHINVVSADLSKWGKNTHALSSDLSKREKNHSCAIFKLT